MITTTAAAIGTATWTRDTSARSLHGIGVGSREAIGVDETTAVLVIEACQLPRGVFYRGLPMAAQTWGVRQKSRKATIDMTLILCRCRKAWITQKREINNESQHRIGLAHGIHAKLRKYDDMGDDRFVM
jgi:hypothetical protein